MIFFVTGGSRGIGEAVVLQAVREGHDVAFTYISREESAAKVIEKARALDPQRKVRAYRLDVAKAAEVDQVGDRVLSDFDTVDAAVCNAAINKDNLVYSMSDEEWGDVIQANLTGSFYVVRKFLETFIANRFGRFVFLSSIAQNGISGQANYAASKAGLCGLSATLSKEYGRKGITSNVVVPGFFDTDMTREFMPQSTKDFWIKFCPQGRMGALDEAAKVITFLASPGAGFVNGQEIPITGGLDWAP